MDSRGSVLVLKKEALFQELDKRQRKENAVVTSQAREVLREKHVVIRVTDYYGVRESVRHVLGVENGG